MIVKINIADLILSPFNIRVSASNLEVDAENFHLLPALTVRKHPTIDGKYELMAGRRRLDVAKRLGLKTVECNLVEMPDEVEASLEPYNENAYRDPVDGISLGLYYLKLSETHGWDIKTTASKLDIDSDTVSACMQGARSYLMSSGRVAPSKAGPESEEGTASASQSPPAGKVEEEEQTPQQTEDPKPASDDDKQTKRSPKNESGDLADEIFGGKLSRSVLRELQPVPEELRSEALREAATEKYTKAEARHLAKELKAGKDFAKVTSEISVLRSKMKRVKNGVQHHIASRAVETGCGKDVGVIWCEEMNGKHMHVVEFLRSGPRTRVLKGKRN